jgi:hypothetical protein
MFGSFVNSNAWRCKSRLLVWPEASPPHTTSRLRAPVLVHGSSAHTQCGSAISESTLIGKDGSGNGTFDYQTCPAMRLLSSILAVYCFVADADAEAEAKSPKSPVIVSPTDAENAARCR